MMFSCTLIYRMYPTIPHFTAKTVGRDGSAIGPDGVRRCLDDRFGEDLKAVRSAMQKLAKAYKPRHGR